MNTLPTSSEPDQPAAGGDDIQVDEQGNVAIMPPPAVAIVEAPPEEN